MSKLKEMFDEYNVFAKSFRMAKDRYDNFQTKILNLQLIVDKIKDGWIYNLPTISKVVVVIVGDAS